MKKQLILVLFCSGLMMNLAAQRIEVKNTQLIKETGTGAYYPKFTPDGKAIVFTAEGYEGLKTLNLQTKKLKQLTTDAGAGYSFAISDDSKTVCFRKMDYSSPDGSPSFYSVNLETQKKQHLLTPTTPGMVRPVQLMKAKAAIKSPVVAFINEDLQIGLIKNGKTLVLTPNGAEESYLYAALSPDKKKIAYFVSSKNEAFVCDLSGKLLASLGILHAIQWLNNNWVVGMDEKDDGHVVTSSKIVGVTANGKIRQELTFGENIAMYPAVSPAGDKIAFNTLDGKLYMMNVIVK